MFAETEILHFACEKFEDKEYDAALEAFILAYVKGYQREEILEHIYSCYMSGNEEEFKKTYQIWKQVDKVVDYEDCLLDFIPYREGEYYIYDKDINEFRGKFFTGGVDAVERETIFEQMEFSALAVSMNWDWSKQLMVLAEAKYRKVYVICQDIKRCASFFKLPELVKYAENIAVFSNEEMFRQYFHENTSVYLPKIFAAGEEEEKRRLIDIVDEEHAYRLTPEGRNVDNVLLTIGIPTHDRGNLLLERLEHLREMPYDAEIEFAISKNGTHYFQEEYHHVATIQDARIKYIGYDKELTFLQNMQSVMKIASGKYVLLVGDEDDVIISALEHYLNYLYNHNEVAVVRSRTMVQYSHIKNSGYYRRGREALLESAFVDLYMSGIIIRKEYLNNVLKDKKYESNVYYSFYPHVWWEMLLVHERDYVRDATVLIQEGESVQREELEKYSREGIDRGVVKECSDIAWGSTYEGRIRQFKDAARLLWNEKTWKPEIRTDCLLILVCKTIGLMHMVYQAFQYKRNEYSEQLRILLTEVMGVMEQWNLDTDQKKKILRSVTAFIRQIEVQK